MTPPAPPARARRWTAWIPDPRWARPVEAALWTYVIALVADIPAYDIPPWALAVIAPITATLGVRAARRRWPADQYGAEVRTSMAWLAAVAATCGTAWIVYACASHPLTAVGWLALGTAWFGSWWAVIYTSAPAVAAAIVEQREQAEVEQATATWNDILASAGLALRVVETTPTRAGFVIGVEPTNEQKPVTFGTLQSRLPDLTVKAAALLARQGVTVQAGDIRLEETEAAHVHLIHVCTKKVLTQSIPYEPFEDGPGTIADPVDVALYEDGRPVELTFGDPLLGGTNGKIVGATGSGKSVFVNSLIGRVGECGDVLVGVVASSKLVPMVYPWIKPWLAGEVERPALDFVAGQDPRQVLLMLAAAYQVVRDRNDRLSNSSTHEPTPAAPAIVLFVEESADMVSQKFVITLHDGRQVGFSELVHLICKEDRSAQVSLILLNQFDLYGALGNFGAEIARNTPLRVCLRTLAPQDGPSVLPGLKASWSDTSKLRHNSMLIQPSTEDPRVMPAKSYALTNDQVGPVAARNARWRPELEPELVDQLGEVWTGRWDAARLPELVAAARRDGLVWPVGDMDEMDELEMELRKMIDEHGPVGEPHDAVEQAAVVEPGPAGEFPDAAAGVADLNAAAARPALTLPEPLGSVMRLLADERAPRDFVSTRQLAILLDRVPGDAPDEELREAARQLGRELAALDGEIRSEQRGRVQGYDVPALRATAARLARGSEAS